MSAGPAFTYRQHLGRLNAQRDSVSVEVVRSVKLDEALSQIKGRRFDCIKVEVTPFSGRGKESSDFLLSRDAAEVLRDLLDRALDETADDPTIWVRDEDVQP